LGVDDEAVLVLLGKLSGSADYVIDQRTPLKDAKAFLGELKDLSGPQTQAQRG
jgi:hypothetical protein